jgi:hypothetical protein
MKKWSILDCESISEWMLNEVLLDGVVRVPRLLDVHEQVTLQYVSALLVLLCRLVCANLVEDEQERSQKSGDIHISTPR